MSWMIMLKGSREDIGRLLNFQPCPLEAVPGEPTQLAHRVAASAEADAARRELREYGEALGEEINGLGKLRWGRAFRGVEFARARSSKDSVGRSDAIVFAESVPAYLTWEDGQRFKENQLGEVTTDLRDTADGWPVA